MNLRRQHLIWGLGLLLVVGLFWSRQKAPSSAPILNPVVENKSSPSVPTVSTNATEPKPADRVAASASAPAAVQESELFLNSSWKIVPQTSALPRAQMPAAAGLKQVSGFVLVASKNISSQESKFFVGRPLIYLNTRTQSYGVLTGVIRVKLKNSESLSGILKAYQLEVAESFAHLKTYMLVSQISPFDLISLTEKLRQDPDVAEVEPEILTRNFEKN